jgi:hypothetical protein
MSFLFWLEWQRIGAVSIRRWGLLLQAVARLPATVFGIS